MTDEEDANVGYAVLLLINPDTPRQRWGYLHDSDEPALTLPEALDDMWEAVGHGFDPAHLRVVSLTPVPIDKEAHRG